MHKFRDIKTITVRLPDELIIDLKVEVAKKQITLKEFVEEAIREKLDKTKI